MIYSLSMCNYRYSFITNKIQLPHTYYLLFCLRFLDIPLNTRLYSQIRYNPLLARVFPIMPLNSVGRTVTEYPTKHRLDDNSTSRKIGRSPTSISRTDQQELKSERACSHGARYQSM